MIQAAVMHRDLTCSRLKVVSALGANKRAEGGVSLNVAGSLLKVISHEEIRRFRRVNSAIFPNSYTHLRTPPSEGIVTGKRDAPGFRLDRAACQQTHPGAPYKPHDGIGDHDCQAEPFGGLSQQPHVRSQRSSSESSSGISRPWTTSGRSAFAASISQLQRDSRSYLRHERAATLSPANNERRKQWVSKTR